jgi:carboxyl-terminal processing protease
MTMRTSLMTGMLASLVALSGVGIAPWNAITAHAAQATATPATTPAAPVAVAPLSVTQFAAESWIRAKNNDLNAILALGAQINTASPEGAIVARDLAQLANNIQKRETTRTEQSEKLKGKIRDLLAKEPTPLNLSNALKEAVELHMLTQAANRDALLQKPELRQLVTSAEKAAREAESKGEWLMANELFARLHLLLEEQGTFKPDWRRQGDRLAMLRLYNPKRFYELRNARQLLDDPAKPLPPFNDTGEDFNDKLRGIDRRSVVTAIARAADNHVERRKTSEVLVGGLTAIRTLITTHDLDDIFPGLTDANAVRELTGFLDTRIAELEQITRNRGAQPTPAQVSELLSELTGLTARTVKLPDAAVLHEFGNGAFDRLDEFSEIIWPDQIARFRRMTEGSFIGVGIQIQIDEESQLIKVVQPIEGTPAQRAGIMAGDLIKKINEKSAVGMSLEQAIEQITGKAGTPVKITMDRDGQEIIFDLIRNRIPIRTAKGWLRTGNADTDWNWFIDQESGIGYVRISGFNETTTRELHTAIRAMGPAMRSLILDLRFNPGGLLGEAVTISNTFIPEGTIVYTEAAGGVRQQTESAEPEGQLVRNIPVIVLINDGSASASEIVSGAVRHYARLGEIKALVLGSRSFGKGSVQNVLPLGQAMQMKLTTQYYHLPGGELIHRRDGARQWGVDPMLAIEMLPKQISDSLTLRLDADAPPEGRVTRKPRPGEEPLGEPEPSRLISEGFDLQLETAVMLLRAQALGAREATAQGKSPTNN